MGIEGMVKSNLGENRDKQSYCKEIPPTEIGEKE
jgi:hypothetical protein